ncbi:MAG TPA: metallophosphoesterase [Acidimicrobiales bacterium]|nr:metallophosphoesterase [Acidimicrobiales bacterium]
MVDRRPLRLVHTSDCHLGNDSGASRPHSREQEAFARLVDLAARARADAVVIAGDMFDSPRAKGPILEWAAAELDRLECPAVILPGNHDVFDDDSAFWSLDFERRCRDVHVLDAPGGDEVVLEGLGVTFFGRPVLDHDPAFRPLADLPPRPERGWGVVVGHGLVMDVEGAAERGSPIYPSDLAAVDWDYVALGHVATFRVVQSAPVPVCYAGNTAQSHAGQPGAVVVDFAPDGTVTPRWSPLAAG